MLRITGDIAELIQLADMTNSTVQLRERLEYLNSWGAGYGCNVNVDMLITKVNILRLEAEVSLRFYTGKMKPVLWPIEPKPTIFGGLNLYEEKKDAFNWSVNT